MQRLASQNASRLLGLGLEGLEPRKETDVPEVGGV